MPKKNALERQNSRFPQVSELRSELRNAKLIEGKNLKKRDRRRITQVRFKPRLWIQRRVLQQSSARRNLPQQPRVVTRTTLTEYGLRRSTLHQGLGSLWVSVHLFPSCSVLKSPSLPWFAFPPLTVVDWFAGLRKPTFVPVAQCSFRCSFADRYDARNFCRAQLALLFAFIVRTLSLSF